jgi:uncharacterized protein YaaQ
MKLILAVIQHEDEDALTDAMELDGMHVTRIGSSGGFLRASNVTLMTAVKDQQVKQVMALLSKHCKGRTKKAHPWVPSAQAREQFLGAIPVQIGGAAVFILSVEHVEKIA